MGVNRFQYGEKSTWDILPLLTDDNMEASDAFYPRSRRRECLSTLK
jgi:hypothetical protein